VSHQLAASLYQAGAPEGGASQPQGDEAPKPADGDVVDAEYTVKS
jgi:hypothetical protein